MYRVAVFFFMIFITPYVDIIRPEAVSHSIPLPLCFLGGFLVHPQPEDMHHGVKAPA
jgi:hypothetical protein